MKLEAVQHEFCNHLCLQQVVHVYLNDESRVSLLQMCCCHEHMPNKPNASLDLNNEEVARLGTYLDAELFWFAPTDWRGMERRALQRALIKKLRVLIET